MDWKIFFTAFGTIFLAELADKTEMAVLNLTAKTKSPWPVFCGAMLAFGIATLLAVVFGGAIGKFVPENILRMVSAGIFILIGVLTLMGKL
ncbi:MAG: TMEM165/GDT1 family protein [Candidatus Omnitrophota bacterium]